ncbi:hypothetical protein F4679DRAFT_562828 [Xylaria curta]|nr:hypothetical protein F4679DRAFT_562828 [Xylaria curta]
MNVFRDPLQGAGFVLSIFFIIVCSFATALRFLATTRANRKIGIEDWFALFGHIFFLVYTTIFLYVLRSLDGQSFAEIQKESPARLQHIFMVALFMSAQYCGNQLFAKLSLLAFYHRIFGVRRDFVISVWLVAVVQIMWFIATYITHYLTCIPISKVWDQSVPGVCIDNSAFLVGGETINSLIDFIMIGLAIWMLKDLRLDIGTKWKLSVLFILGGLSGVIGFIKIGLAHNASYSSFLDPIWAVIQMAFSVLCSCMPVYKSLLSAIPSFGITYLLRSWAGHSGLARKSSPQESTKGSHK